MKGDYQEAGSLVGSTVVFSPTASATVTTAITILLLPLIFGIAPCLKKNSQRFTKVDPNTQTIRNVEVYMQSNLAMLSSYFVRFIRHDVENTVGAGLCKFCSADVFLFLIRYIS